MTVNETEAAAFLKALAPAVPRPPTPGFDIRLATVQNVSSANGGISVIFDGETTDSGMYYRVLAPCHIGDRVAMQVIGRTYAALGPIATLAPMPRVIDHTTVGVGGLSVYSVAVPASYRHVRIDWFGRSSNAGTLTDLGIRFNGVSTANYNSNRAQVLNVTQTNTVNPTGNTYGCAGSLFEATAAAGAFSNGTVDITGWSLGGSLSWTFLSGGHDGVAGDSNQSFGAGLYNGGGGAVSVQLLCSFGNFVQSSQFTTTAW